MLEAAFEAGDRSKPLSAAELAALLSEVDKLRQKYADEIRDADLQCNGPHCRMLLSLASGRQLKRLAAQSHWVGDRAGLVCSYEATSEPGPPAVSKPQKLWAYFRCRSPRQPSKHP